MITEKTEIAFRWDADGARGDVLVASNTWGVVQRNHHGTRMTYTFRGLNGGPFLQWFDNAILKIKVDGHKHDPIDPQGLKDRLVAAVSLMIEQRTLRDPDKLRAERKQRDQELREASRKREVERNERRREKVLRIIADAGTWNPPMSAVNALVAAIDEIANIV